MPSIADGVGGLIAQVKEAGKQLPLRLVTMMIDDSTSMRHFDNHKMVIGGHNSVLDMLAASGNAPLFLAKTQYMHGKALADEYRPLSQAPRMTLENYQLTGGTPLFSASARILWYVKRRARDYAKEGYDVCTLTLILTDGWNRQFIKPIITAQDVFRVARPMIASGRHIIAGVGIANPRADFKQTFLDMGIPERWILTLRSADEIRAAFGAFAGSVERSSTSRREFGETQSQGFGGTSTAK